MTTIAKPWLPPRKTEPHTFSSNKGKGKGTGKDKVYPPIHEDV